MSVVEMKWLGALALQTSKQLPLHRRSMPPRPVIGMVTSRTGILYEREIPWTGLLLEAQSEYQKCGDKNVNPKRIYGYREGGNLASVPPLYFCHALLQREKRHIIGEHSV